MNDPILKIKEAYDLIDEVTDILDESSIPMEELEQVWILLNKYLERKGVIE